MLFSVIINTLYANYIIFNTFFILGKTMENVRNRIKMELVSSETRFQKLINKPTFKHSITYGENLATVTLQNKVIEFNKPIYIGKQK